MSCSEGKGRQHARGAATVGSMFLVCPHSSRLAGPTCTAVTEICMDLDSGEAAVRRVCELAGDFPVVPPVLVGAAACLSVCLPACCDGVHRFAGLAALLPRLAAQKRHQGIRVEPS